MTSRPGSDERAQLHGPWPTEVEVLQAEFGDQWEIWRELRPDGRHGDWIARRWDGPHGERELLRADSIEGLAAALEGDDPK